MTTQKMILFACALGFGFSAYVQARTIRIKDDTCDAIELKIKAKFECGWSFERMNRTVRHMIISSSEIRETPDIQFSKCNKIEISVRKVGSNKKFQKLCLSDEINTLSSCGMLVIESNDCGNYVGVIDDSYRTKRSLQESLQEDTNN